MMNHLPIFLFSFFQQNVSHSEIVSASEYNYELPVRHLRKIEIAMKNFRRIRKNADCFHVFVEEEEGSVIVSFGSPSESMQSTENQRPVHDNEMITITSSGVYECGLGVDYTFDQKGKMRRTYPR